MEPAPTRAPAGTALVPAGAPGPFDVLSERVLARRRAGDVAGAMGDARAALALCTAAGDPQTALYLHHLLGQVALDAGDVDTAVAAAHVLLGLPAAAGVDVWHTKGLSLLARSHVQSGRFAEALEVVSEALAGMHVGHRHDDVTAAVSVAAALRGLLLFERAVELLEASAHLTPPASELRVRVCAALTRTHLLWGDVLTVLDDAGAPARFSACLSAARRWSAAAREAGTDDTAACAAEARAWAGLGEQQLAVARGLGALGPAARGGTGGGGGLHLVEVQAAMLVQASAAARSGDAAGVRAVLDALDAAGSVSEDEPVWRLVRWGARVAFEQMLAAAPGAPPRRAALAAATLLQGLARDSLGRLWRDRALRVASLDALSHLGAAEAERSRVVGELLVDPLTGVGNRRRLMVELRRESDPVPGATRWAAVVFCDVDRFKHVNDAFSHDVGDAVLAVVGSVVAASCRAGDVVVRFGGDEFVVLVPHGRDRSAVDRGAQQVARRVRAGVRAHDFSALHPDLTCSVSVGVAVAPSWAEGLSRADEAMLAAKRGGRDRVVTA